MKQTRRDFLKVNAASILADYGIELPTAVTSANSALPQNIAKVVPVMTMNDGAFRGNGDAALHAVIGHVYSKPMRDDAGNVISDNAGNTIYCEPEVQDSRSLQKAIEEESKPFFAHIKACDQALEELEKDPNGLEQLIAVFQQAKKQIDKPHLQKRSLLFDNALKKNVFNIQISDDQRAVFYNALRATYYKHYYSKGTADNTQSPIATINRDLNKLQQAMRRGDEITSHEQNQLWNLHYHVSAYLADQDRSFWTETSENEKAYEEAKVALLQQFGIPELAGGSGYKESTVHNLHYLLELRDIGVSQLRQQLMQSVVDHVMQVAGEAWGPNETHTDDLANTYSLRVIGSHLGISAQQLQQAAMNAVVQLFQVYFPRQNVDKFLEKHRNAMNQEKVEQPEKVQEHEEGYTNRELARRQYEYCHGRSGDMDHVYSCF